MHLSQNKGEVDGTPERHTKQGRLYISLFIWVGWETREERVIYSVKEQQHCAAH